MERNGVDPSNDVDLPFVLGLNMILQDLDLSVEKRNYKNIFLIFDLRSTRSQTFLYTSIQRLQNKIFQHVTIMANSYINYPMVNLILI